MFDPPPKKKLLTISVRFGIDAIIRIGWEIQCLPYGEFFNIHWMSAKSEICSTGVMSDKIIISYTWVMSAKAVFFPSHFIRCPDHWPANCLIVVSGHKQETLIRRPLWTYIIFRRLFKLFHKYMTHDRKEINLCVFRQNIWNLK